MSFEIPRPIDPSLHPLSTGNYRIATPAIREFYDLVVRCLHYRIMGALIYGLSRLGKTRVIEGSDANEDGESIGRWIGPARQ